MEENTLDTLEKVKLAVAALEDKKAADIKVLDISEISVIADFFIIATGANEPQIKAMVDNVDEVLSKHGIKPKSTEGYNNANWVLLDYGDIIIHIFDEENRSFYDLERIWRDGKEIEL